MKTGLGHTAGKRLPKVQPLFHILAENINDFKRYDDIQVSTPTHGSLYLRS